MIPELLRISILKQQGTLLTRSSIIQLLTSFILINFMQDTETPDRTTIDYQAFGEVDPLNDGLVAYTISYGTQIHSRRHPDMASETNLPVLWATLYPDARTRSVSVRVNPYIGAYERQMVLGSLGESGYFGHVANGDYPLFVTYEGGSARLTGGSVPPDQMFIASELEFPPLGRLPPPAEVNAHLDTIGGNIAGLARDPDRLSALPTASAMARAVGLLSE